MPTGTGKILCRKIVPYTMLNVKGKGHFVGTVLQAQGLKTGMTIFFEGDDSTVVDGELRMHGTGSEDFFNGGWYALMDRWDGPIAYRFRAPVIQFLFAVQGVPLFDR